MSGEAPAPVTPVEAIPVIPTAEALAPTEAPVIATRGLFKAARNRRAARMQAADLTEQISEHISELPKGAYMDINDKKTIFVGEGDEKRKLSRKDAKKYKDLTKLETTRDAALEAGKKQSWEERRQQSEAETARQKRMREIEKAHGDDARSRLDGKGTLTALEKKELAIEYKKLKAAEPKPVVHEGVLNAREYAPIRREIKREKRAAENAARAEQAKQDAILLRLKQTKTPEDHEAKQSAARTSRLAEIASELEEFTQKDGEPARLSKEQIARQDELMKEVRDIKFVEGTLKDEPFIGPRLSELTSATKENSTEDSGQLSNRQLRRKERNRQQAGRALRSAELNNVPLSAETLDRLQKQWEDREGLSTMSARRRGLAARLGRGTSKFVLPTDRSLQNSQDAWNWAVEQGIDSTKAGDFLSEVVGENWRETIRTMKKGDKLRATAAQVAKYKG